MFLLFDPVHTMTFDILLFDTFIVCKQNDMFFFDVFEQKMSKKVDFY